MRKINVADITLKQLSEDRAVSLLFREKSAIATCADKLFADCIELRRTDIIFLFHITYYILHIAWYYTFHIT